MTTFNERENAFEAQFAHQEDIKFKVRERAVGLLAFWAAERLHKSAEASEAYAREIVATDVADPNSGLALERVVADLRSRGIGEQEVRQARERLVAQAEQSIRGSVS